MDDAKIRAVCFAPTSDHNDVLFLAKSIPTITYTPLRCPTTLSPQGRNMPPSSPHATAVSWDLGMELTEGEGLQFSTSGCSSTPRSDGPFVKTQQLSHEEPYIDGRDTGETTSN